MVELGHSHSKTDDTLEQREIHMETVIACVFRHIMLCHLTHRSSRIGKKVWNSMRRNVFFSREQSCGGPRAHGP